MRTRTKITSLLLSMVLLLNTAYVPVLATEVESTGEIVASESSNTDNGTTPTETETKQDDSQPDDGETYYSGTEDGVMSVAEEGNNQGNGNNTTVATGIAATLIEASKNPDKYQEATIQIGQTGGGTIDLSDTDFAGLGSADYPFMGTITFAAGSESLNIILGDSALFNYIADSAKIEGTIYLNTNGNHTKPVFAENVVSKGGTGEWSVRITEVTGDENTATEFSFGGIIGTMAANSNVTLSVNIQATSAALVSSADAGLFCNTMESGASLTAKALDKSVDVTAKGGNAGGFVGSMGEGASLTIASGVAYTGAVTASKSAGGLVGYAVNPTLTLPSGYTVSNVTVKGADNSGGVIGELTASGSVNLPAVSGVTLSGGTYAGGLFGTLNFNGTGIFSLNEITASTSLSASASNYGGLIGKYTCTSLVPTLSISGGSVTSTAGKNAASCYGGIIGWIPSASTAYIEFDGVSVTTSNSSCNFYGGLVAASDGKNMLNVSNVTVDAGTFCGGKAGGLVGSLGGGVLRLSGTTMLTGSPSSGSTYAGLIVGYNNGGLVYAPGKGTSNAWSFTGSASASNIGNWGDVLRLSDIESNILSFDSTNHTVTVLAASAEINSITDFARLALHMQLFATRGGALLFADNSSFLDAAITLNNDITLSSGLLGLMRDDGAGDAFTGSLDGGEHKITLGVSDIYVSENCHNYLGLFAQTSRIKVTNLTLAGSISFTLDSRGSKDAKTYASALSAQNSGDFTAEKVAVSTNISYGGSGANATEVVGGLIATTDKGTITVSEYTWSGKITVSTKRADIINAGVIALVSVNGGNITVKDSTLSGTIEYTATNAGAYARVGGLIASIPQTTTDKTTLTISNVSLTGENITTTVTYNNNATNSGTGGLLGFEWFNTQVDLSGLTISGCALSNSATSYGGLVYKASGYWKVHKNEDGVGVHFTEKNNFEKTTTFNDAPSGLLVARGDGVNVNNTYYAIYMEIGPEAYVIDEDAVTLGAYTKAFDEIVGTTISGANDRNGVVSIATDAEYSLIDQNGACNTYKPQIVKSDAANNNSKTRYYYNIDKYRGDGSVNLTTVDSAEKLLLWSLRFYAANNIKDYFGAKEDAYTITGNIDLTGYSYYPISLSSNKTSIKDAVITFDNLGLSNAESAVSNRTPDDSNRQHYMMHTGLFTDVSAALNISSLTLRGTVGAGQNGYGAIANGTASGSSSGQTSISASDITLDGIRLVSKSSGSYTTEADASVSAPLLINKISQYVTLNMSGVTTTEEYTKDGKTPLVAGSLIGNIGNGSTNGAEKIQLLFSDMVLDARTSAGEKSDLYHTYNSIFYKATFIESIQANDSSYSGVYDFSSTENCTYGYEISNSVRNPGEQYWYSNEADRVKNTNYVYDPLNSAKQNADDAFSTGYLRYVGTTEVKGGLNRELDTNIWKPDVDAGCGTYSDPYQVTDGRILLQVARYLSYNPSAAGLTLIVDSAVLGALDGSVAHAESNHVKITCYYDASSKKLYWKDEKNNTYSNYDNIKLYLSNAYYEIEKDIELTSAFAGLGGENAKSESGNSIAFSGTIFGKAQTGGTYPTITISTPGTSEQYGGLIKYSQGSVVKNLNIAYSGSITVTCDKVPGNGANSTNSAVGGSFFGGVVGYCIGGDTIIENVSVSYANFSVSTSGTYANLAAVGGYVGLIGGYAETTGYEVKGGGVIFRNISSVGLDTSGSDSYYYNPYVGRVLDGYAASEDCTLDNTDNNYAIPQLDKTLTSLYAERKNSTFEIKAYNAQNLWVLSAIVNSGGADMNWYGNYTYKDKDWISDAYYYGKVRSDNDAADEKWWGGKQNQTSDWTRTCYLINAGYASTDTARIASYYDSDAYTLNLAENTTYDMSVYSSGFRGIGARYIFNENMKNPHRTLRINALNGNGSTIKFGQTYNIYSVEESAKGEWSVVGAGLFTVLNMSSGTVQDLTFTGTIAVNKTSYGASKTSTVSGVGALAGGFSYKGRTDITIKNLTLTELSVTGDIAAGGIIGSNGYAGSNGNGAGRNITFEDCVYSDLTVTANYSAGGFIGVLREAGIDVSFTKDTTFGKAEILTAYAANESYVGAGGLVGSYYKSASELSLKVDGGDNKVTFTDLTVKGIGNNNYTRGVGGILGNCEGSYGAVIISNINFQSLTVKGYGDNAVSWNGSSRYAGGVVGLFGGDASLTLTNITIAPTDSGKVNIGNALASGGLVGYLETGGAVSITDCTLKGTSEDNRNVVIYSNRNGNAFTGGALGTVNKGTNIVIDNFLFENAIVATRAESRAGGIVGRVGTSHSIPVKIQVTNTTFRNSAVVGDNEKSNVGSLAGRIAFKNCGIAGYNILLDNMLIGRVTSQFTAGEGAFSSGFVVSADTVGLGGKTYTALDGSFTENSSNITDTAGVWAGTYNENDTSVYLKLVGVRVTGAYIPNQAVGNYNNSALPDTSYIVYADHDNASEGDASKIVTSPAGSIGGIAVTGDASIPSTASGAVGSIISEYNSNKASKQNLMYNMVTSEIEHFDASGKYASSLSTYAQAGENGTENQPNDFSVLVIDTNISSEITKLVNEYIAVVTNCKTASYSSISAETYSYNGSGFTKNATSTLVWNAASKLLRVNGSSFDNTQSQFTLLDVQYNDPSGASSNVVMHLYIPVVVQKVMEFNFYASLLTGTDYYAGDYTGNSHVIVAHGDKITALLTYQYFRTTAEWQTALENGENLMTNFTKSLALTNNVTVPEGTMLTLVDRAQASSAYTMTVGSGGISSGEKLNFTSFTSITGGSAWSNLPICDYLPLTAEEDSTGAYVVTDKANATVRVGETYYRLAADGETETRYKITVGEIDGGVISETYFLTIQTPTGQSLATLNNSIELGSSTLSGYIPTRRKDSKNAKLGTENAYIMLGSIASQKLAVTATTDITEMTAENNSLSFTLTDTLSIDSEVKQTFSAYKDGITMFQRFSVELKQYDANSSETLTTIPQGTVVRVQYSVGGVSAATTQFSVQSATTSLNIDLPETVDLKNLLLSADTSVTLTANVTLTYTDEGLAMQFPERSNNDANIGVGVSARSSIAYSSQSLQSSPINRTELTPDSAGKRYYRGTIELASLNYVAYEYDFGDETGDISQLGINPSDTLLTSVPVTSLGNYDVASLSAAKNASQIKYILTLYVKNSGGEYEAVDITKYLTDITIDGASGAEVTKDWTYQEDTEIPISFKVKTGTELEESGYTYANYRVQLETELLDNSGKSIDGSAAKDYIIYTNARIYTGIVSVKN